MSQSPLAPELHQLRVELANLSARVLALEEAALRSRATESPLQGSPLTVNYLGAGILPEVPQFLELRQPVSVTSSFESQQSVLGPAAIAAAPTLTEAERRRIAEEAGAFIRRSLEGNHRGSSGRSRLPPPSTVYILARDYAGVTYNPVRVFRDFGAIRPLVKRQGSCGNSVFIGFPTIWEARACVEAAQLSWPDG